MPVVASRRTLSTTPLLIATGLGGASGDHVTVIVKTPSATIYLGGPTVDSTNGLPVSTTEGVTIDLINGDVLYAVASAGTPTVQVLATRQ